MRNSTKFLARRLERLAAEHPKLRTLHELYKLRSDFAGLGVMPGKDEVQESLARGSALNLLLIGKIDVESYAASVAAFAKQVLEIAPDEGLRRIVEEIGKRPRLATEMYRATARSGFLTLPAKIDKEFLRFVSEAPLMSALEKLAVMLPDNTPAKSSCVVCNTKFTLGVYSQRKRYLLCKNCGARIHVDLLKCPACGNRDATKLGFLKLEDEPQFQVDYCTECGSYIKAADEDALGKISDAALLDLATLDLDALAEERELGEKTKEI